MENNKTKFEGKLLEFLRLTVLLAVQKMDSNNGITAQKINIAM